MYQVVKAGPIDLIYSPFSGFETASLGIFLKTGARFEKKQQKGIAHFLEHMLFKGSSTYGYKRIKREIEGRGGMLNGFTSQEITAYYACFLQKNSLISLDILLDMVFNPLFLKKDIEKERKVILEEIKMYEDLPSSRVKTILDNVLWKGHPLGTDIIGYRQTVENITKKALIGFKNNFYRPSNMVISFCGGFPLEKIKKLIEKKVKIKKENRKNIVTAPKLHRGKRIVVEKKDTQQAHLCLGFRSISYHSRQRDIQNLLHVILGANMSSRFFESLREKKPLCYDVSTQIREFKDSGAFILRLGLDEGKIKLALQTIKKELEKIAKKEVSKNELSRAKDYFSGQFSMSFEQPQGRMFYLAQSYIRYFKLESPNQIKNKVKRVKPCQIRAFAAKLFNFKNVCLAVVGNVSQDLAKEARKILN